MSKKMLTAEKKPIYKEIQESKEESKSASLIDTFSTKSLEKQKDAAYQSLTELHPLGKPTTSIFSKDSSIEKISEEISKDLSEIKLDPALTKFYPTDLSTPVSSNPELEKTVSEYKENVADAVTQFHPADSSYTPMSGVIKESVITSIVTPTKPEDEPILFTVFGSKNRISKTDTKYNWFTVDEIQYKKHAFGREIAPELVEIFEHDPRITEIKTQDGKQISFPIVLYMCEKPEDLYHNLSITKENEHLETVADLVISHPLFGEGYTFSSVALDRETKSDFNYELLKRYAVFTKSSQYVLKDIANLTEEEKAWLNASNSDKDIITVYYHDDGLQLWHVYSSNWFVLLD